MFVINLHVFFKLVLLLLFYKLFKNSFYITYFPTFPRLKTVLLCDDSNPGTEISIIFNLSKCYFFFLIFYAKSNWLTLYLPNGLFKVL